MNTNGHLRGYRRKPRAIFFIAGVFLAMPLVTLAQLVAQSGGGWTMAWPLAHSDYFLQEWVLAWSAALAAFVVSRISFGYLVFLSGYVLVTRLSHAWAHPELETPGALLVTAGWLGVVLVLTLSSVRAPYLNPRLRWWTRPPRVSLLSRATITAGRIVIPVHILNLSEGGAFIKLADSDALVPPPMQLGDRVVMTAELSRTAPSEAPLRLTVAAQLVWQGKPDSPYAQGFGLQFLNLPRPDRRQLKRYLRDEARRA